MFVLTLTLLDPLRIAHPGVQSFLSGSVHTYSTEVLPDRRPGDSLYGLPDFPADALSSYPS